jgi:hypothetical protein
VFAAGPAQSAMGISFQAAVFGVNLALSALIETDV